MYYAIKRTNITTNSILISFGSISACIITAHADVDNSADVYIDWDGGIAVCPKANTAGNFCLAPGQTITLDIRGVNRDKISLIAESGTQTVSILALQ